MLVLTLLLVIVVVFGAISVRKNTGAAEIVSGVLALGSLVLLVVAVIFIPVTRMSGQAEIIKYNEFSETLKRARQKGAMTDLERAAIQQKIAEFNCWRVEMQYWNNSVFDIWNPDEVDALKPLE